MGVVDRLAMPVFMAAERVELKRETCEFLDPLARRKGDPRLHSFDQSCHACGPTAFELFCSVLVDWAVSRRTGVHR